MRSDFTRKTILVIASMALGYASWTLPVLLIPGTDSGELPLLIQHSTNLALANLGTVLGLLATGLTLGFWGDIENRKWALLVGSATGFPIIVFACTEMSLGLARHNLWPIEFFMYAIYTIPAILGVWIGVFAKRSWMGRKVTPETMGASGTTKEPKTQVSYRVPLLGILIAIILSSTLVSFCEAPSSPSRKNEELRRAAKKGQVEVVRELLAMGADPNYLAGGWSTLMHVAREGHTQVARLLLESGIDPNFRGGEGSAALTIASEHGHVDLVRLLLSKGADVNAKTYKGNTALMFSAEYCRKEVAQVLLQAGADVDSRDKDGETAYMMAARRSHVEIMQMLRKAGAKEEAPRTDFGLESRKSNCH